MSSVEEQLIDLQTRVAFQDDTIQALNEALSHQQLELERLTQMVKVLNAQLKQVVPESGANQADEPPPPHY
ncbi:MAG: SlyX family protein [Halopseudomonas sp.]